MDGLTLRAVVVGALVILCLPAAVRAQEPPAAIMIAKQGSFAAGGQLMKDAASGGSDRRSSSCGHGYVEYQIPVGARDLPLFLWHSSSPFVWQNRWDGEEGFQSLFLRRDYAVFVWDGPGVGRADWGCEDYDYDAEPGRDQQNFTSWRLGAEWMEWFPGVQFPTGDAFAFDQAMRARYNEFDTLEAIRREADAAAAAFEEIGPAIAVTASAGGMRALLAAAQTDNIRAIVAYENPGYLFPDGEGPNAPESPFGPMRVSEEEFDRLLKIPMQFVWGDNIEASPIWSAKLEECREFVALVNARGGQAEILILEDVGLTGNTHMPFADLNNREVAGLMADFLARHGLDSR